MYVVLFVENGTDTTLTTFQIDLYIQVNDEIENKIAYFHMYISEVGSVRFEISFGSIRVSLKFLKN